MQYPLLEPVLEDLLPKKSPLIVAKWLISAISMQFFIFFFLWVTLYFLLSSFLCSQNHLNLVVVNNVPLFFNIRDGPYMPTLRLLHQCKLSDFYLFSSIVLSFPLNQSSSFLSFANLSECCGIPFSTFRCFTLINLLPVKSLQKIGLVRVGHY